MTQPLPQEVIILTSKIEVHYNLEEMARLSFSLGCNPEEIVGNTPGEKARELVLYFHRRKKTSQLLEQVKTDRPNVDFTKEITIPIIARELPVERQRELQFLLEQLHVTYDELIKWKEVHNRLDRISNQTYGPYAKEVKNLYGEPVSTAVHRQLLDVWDPIVKQMEAFLDWVVEKKYIGLSSQDRLPENEAWFRKIETRYLNVAKCLKQGLPFSVSEEERQLLSIFRKNRKQKWTIWWVELYELTRELENQLQTQLSRADDKLKQTADELLKQSEKLGGSTRT